VWHDAIVPVVTALLAQWLFASCPVQHELAMAFVIVSRPSNVVSTGVGSCSWVVGCLVGRSAGCLDPKLQGQCLGWLGQP
jgi:hypothetical protein